MEASERQQLPLDGDAADGTVRALDDRLVIERLTVEDERAAKVVRERAKSGRPAPETVAKAIEIGARVLDSEVTAANVDYVRAEFERHSSVLRERMTKAIEAGDQALAERIALSFDASRDGSVQQEIEAMVSEALADERQSLLKLFKTEDGVNPLFDFKDAMVRVYKELRSGQQADGVENRKVIAQLKQEIVELKERIDAERRVAESEAVGTRKGRNFEDRVHDAIDRIGSSRGDSAHHVGDERGAGGSKKGDTVVELGAAEGACLGRIVFEAKDEKLSKNRAWEELNGALAERDADFAILVVAGEENVPSGREQLVEYEGNKLIIAVDPELPNDLGLDLAYRYARLRVLMTRDHSLEVDAAGVRDAAEAARSALKRAQSVRLALTNIDKSTKTARDGIEGIVADVEAELLRIESLVMTANAG